MTTQEFMQTLRKNKKLELAFAFQQGRRLPKGYHLTEVKNVRIDAVDCGGAADSWAETVIQLWLPSKTADDEPMTAGKALKILEKVQTIRPMESDAVCRFEADAESGTTVVYDILDIQSRLQKLTIRLTSQKTQCKAQKRDASACGGSCEAPSEATACCN